jgi:hypothetical protein
LQVLQTKNQEPGTHDGVAHSFGLVFLFQALSALFLVFSEQLYEGYFSLYCSILCVVFTFFAVIFCIPAASNVAVPDGQRQAVKTGAVIASGTLIVLCIVVLSPKFDAGPDIPYMTLFLRKAVLGGILGSLLVLVAASLVRLMRQLKGRNGAFILFAGLSLVLAFGVVWMRYEPLCAQEGPAVSDWPASCPLPREFDHNVLFTLVLVVANVLSAEGVLRLMAAGTGAEGYTEIITVR